MSTIAKKAGKLVKNENKSSFVPTSNWEEILENIKIMRVNRTAPVDSQGPHKAADKNAEPKLFRFQTLVSLMLSSQTKDQVTYAAVQRLVQHNIDPHSVVKMDSSELQKLIYPVGFYKKKAIYLAQASQILLEKYDSDIPNTVDGLIELPGVGYKMAHICMRAAWNKVTGIGVDTHVHRICNRLKWAQTKTPEDTRLQLEGWLPRDQWKDINVLLAGFGQEICKPIGPNCAECLNNSICPKVGINNTKKGVVRSKSVKKEERIKSETKNSNQTIKEED